jgi:hypothetical protein
MCLYLGWRINVKITVLLATPSKVWAMAYMYMKIYKRLGLEATK